MSQAKSDEQPKMSDRIMRALIDGGRARVVVVTATQALREMVARHRMSGIPVVALGRASVAGLLLATLTKDEEQVTLQVVGNGPLGTITVDARSSGRVRGFLKHASAVGWDPGLAKESRISIASAVGKEGVVGVIRDLGLAHNYSGQVAIGSGEIDVEVESYLNTSEQIDSVLHCDVLLDSEGHVRAAAGMLIQTLPQAHGAAVVEFLRDTLRGEAFSTALRQSLDEATMDPSSLARRTLGRCAEDMQALDERKVTFFCPCSRERAASTLGLLRPDDLKEMILETNEAEVTCNFCGAAYRFSEADLESIRRKHDKPQMQS